MTIETLQAMATEIEQLPGVQSVNLWTSAPGRERLYVELTKHNGGRGWHGGCGRKLYIDASGSIVDDRYLGDWAGAATRHRHEELGTMDAIRAIRDARRAPVSAEVSP